MPKELYEEVKEEIPSYIGVHNGNYCIKRAKKQTLTIDEQILKDSMIRSLSRENEKFINTCDVNYINKLKNQIERLEREKNENHNRYCSCSNAIFEICHKYNLDYEEVRQLIKNIY